MARLPTGPMLLPPNLIVVTDVLVLSASVRATALESPMSVLLRCILVTAVLILSAWASASAPESPILLFINSRGDGGVDLERIGQRHCT